MSTTVLTPGKAVKVGPAEPGAAEVLEYAAELITTEGWNQFLKTKQESSPTVGWTLHDAIGEANTRLYKPLGGNDKEGLVTSSGDTTRKRAVTAVLNAIGNTTADADKTFNDEAKKMQEVLDVLKKAREEVIAT